MDKQKILNHIADGHHFLEMLEGSFPKARNNVNNIAWVFKAIKDEVNKVDAPVAITPVTPLTPQPMQINSSPVNSKEIKG